MHLASAFAAPPVFHYSPRVAAQAARSSAVADAAISPVAATQGASARTATTEQGQQEQAVSRRMTAEDFAAIQATMGLLRQQDEALDEGIPGEITPAELLEVIEGDDDLSLVTIAEAPTPRDFSDAVADAVVTVDEYLEWVLEAGVGGH